MVNGKEMRRITGLTYLKQLQNHNLWFENALSFYQAANIIYGNKTSIKNGFKVYAFNAALSIELILKAILVVRKSDLKYKHKLNELAQEAGIQLDADQKLILDSLTSIFTWSGRYPTPTSEKEWDSYYNDFEKYVIRSSTGNTHRIVANMSRYPSLENYIKLWELCIEEYKSCSS